MKLKIFSQVGRRRRRSVHQYARLRLRSRCGKMVGLGGFEPPTSPLSGVRSNQLSYRPGAGAVLPRLINIRKQGGIQNLAIPGLVDQVICVSTQTSMRRILFKEVIQPQVPLRLPCYDFTPVMNHKVVTVLPKVRLATSFATHSHGVTGGVYKARERIHRSSSDLRLLAIPTSCSRVADCNPD